MKKSKKEEKFLKAKTEKLLKDTLKHLGVSGDKRIMRAITGLLSLDEHKRVDCLPVVVAGNKAIVICEDPGPIAEVVLIDEGNPEKIYRRRLLLKCENKTAKA